MHSVGLGLALVDTVARRHGGQVSVQSEPGSGALFVLQVPLAAEAIIETRRQADEPSRVRPPQ
jgi:signal transduction histidine kinase